MPDPATAPLPLPPSTPVAVVGAGAMGTGIAQVALLRGHPVALLDARPEALDRARPALERALGRAVEKGRLTDDARRNALARLTLASADQPHALGDAGLVIEAVVEDLEVKRALFRELEAAVGDACLLATNTSSLSVGAIAAACRRPERVVGIHFFNPAPVMPLVEIVPGVATSAHVAATARATVDAWGKTTVAASDTPGFIVNRIARPFYGEAIRLVEEGIADAPTVDWALHELAGFRMGPFELMDFIGNDVNYAVTRSVWEGFFHDPRYTPSFTQRRLVEAGWLGLKTERGHYDYRDGAPRPAPTRDPLLGQAIVDRVLAMLVNEAVDAVYLRVASPADVELAMTRGVNYPRGLLAWGNALGLDTVLARLDALHAEYLESRYRASPLLRRMVREGRSFEL